MIHRTNAPPHQDCNYIASNVSFHVISIIISSFVAAAQSPEVQQQTCHDLCCYKLLKSIACKIVNNVAQMFVRFSINV